MFSKKFNFFLLRSLRDEKKLRTEFYIRVRCVSVFVILLHFSLLSLFSLLNISL